MDGNLPMETPRRGPGQGDQVSRLGNLPNLMRQDACYNWSKQAEDVPRQAKTMTTDEAQGGPGRHLWMRPSGKEAQRLRFGQGESVIGNKVHYTPVLYKRLKDCQLSYTE